jgi:hypothetical protein
VGVGGDEHLDEVRTEVVGQLCGTRAQGRTVLAGEHRHGDDGGSCKPRGRDVAQRELGR